MGTSSVDLANIDLTPAQRDALLGMHRGCRLVGSSLGKATLHDDPFTHDVHQRTHAALIRKGLVVRAADRARDGSWACDWVLTAKGREVVRQIIRWRELLGDGGRND